MKNKKVWIIIGISLFAALLITSGICAYFYVKKNSDITFKLKGKKEITISLLEDYKDPGYELLVNKKREKATIDNDLDNTKVGTYKIKYTFKDKLKHNHKLERTINVIDDAAPVITLKGADSINILLKEEFNDPGYEVSDNYDSSENLQVDINGEIDNTKKGKYTIEYVVSDKSSNTASVSRTINVIEPKKVVTYTETKAAEKETKVENIVTSSDNTITKNSFTSNGVSLTGYLKGQNDAFVIHLKNDSVDLPFNMNKNGEYYNGIIDFTNIENGSYTLFINDVALKNKMEQINRIVRAKVGEKLVTFNYDDGVKVTVEDFAYQYDILIDVGHGGKDAGASNKYMYEKNMNLIISKYEKCRYQEMGLNVLMVREDDTYGQMMGPTSWNELTRRAYYMGYYGTVSKVVYSNHNNSTPSNKAKGFEILTPAALNISREVNILNDVKNAYPVEEATARAYARNYTGGGIFISSAGQNYDFRNYYCVIRVPYELFNTKVVIYEGAYLSNDSDFNFFWNDGNWKRISEIKIKNYMEELGKEYIETTVCS